MVQGKPTAVYDILNAGPRRRFTGGPGHLLCNCFLELYGGEEEKLFSVMASLRDKTNGKLVFPNLTPEDVELWHKNWHKSHPETKRWHALCHAAVKIREEEEGIGYARVPMLDMRKRFFPGGPSKKNAVPNLSIQGCKPATARVLTSDGLWTIQELQRAGSNRPKKVWTGLQWAPYEVLEMGEAEQVAVTLSNGQRIICDVRHRFRTPNADESDSNWVHVLDLKPGDRIARMMPKPLEFGYAQNLEDMYWAGYATGNGNLPLRRKCVQFTIGCRSHASLQDQVTRCVRWFQSHTDVCPQVRWLIDGGDKPKRRTSPDKATHAAVNIHCTRILHRLEALGLQRGTVHRDKRVPAGAWRANLEGRKAFLRGYLDADGCLFGTQQPHNRKYARGLNTPSAVSASEHLIRDILLLSQTCGLDGTIYGPFKADKAGHLAWRVTLWRRLLHEHLGYGPQSALRSAPSALRSEAERAVTQRKDILSRYANRESAGTILARVRRGGQVSAHQLVLMGCDIPYVFQEVTQIERLNVKEMQYTLSVDAPEHQYVADSTIDKNSAASIANKAIIAIAKRIPHRGWSPLSGLVLQVHDSIMVQVPVDRAEEAKKILAEEMAFSYEGVAFTTDVGISTYWSGQD